MKKILFITIIILAPFWVFSQNDALAIKHLDKLATKIDNTKSLDASFTFILVDRKTEYQDTAYGQLLLFNNKYKLQMLGQEIYSDGQTSWTYIQDIEEINIVNADEEDESNNFMNPKNLLLNYKEKYKCKFVSDKFINNRTLVEIILYPKEITEASYSSITLWIDKTKNQIHGVQYSNKNGEEYFINFDKYNENASISEQSVTFKSSKYPDAEIIDMRE